MATTSLDQRSLRLSRNERRPVGFFEVLSRALIFAGVVGGLMYFSQVMAEVIR